MEYRQLPHGGETEKFSVLGLGTGGSSVYAPLGQTCASDAGTATGAARSIPRKAPVCRRSPRIFKMQNHEME